MLKSSPLKKIPLLFACFQDTTIKISIHFFNGLFYLFISIRKNMQYEITIKATGDKF